ncbi:serine protease SohB [Natronocella acetinitrilica]|uniref:Serine protease SohB n=1 Tax=Natronocella acetinitrilica TaxID=414046 RepID=A0AAE3G4Z9_9GAMM|nr:protease SohB [Natronocella acetinitrilica]MCP1675164.1 serine protease SohB [Natronocella acetinitrilica]
MELLSEYGLFLAKTLTLAAAVLIVVGTIISMGSRGRDRSREQLVIRKLNQRYQDMEQTLRQAVVQRPRRRLRLPFGDRKKDLPDEKPDPERKRVYVLRFDGDLRASKVDSLREEISAVLTLARPGQDEVVVTIESGGGLVHSYGLAASQLARLRQHEVALTAAVDKVAASGGYMMAAVANRIIAAPFAIVGSIGVVAQIPNLHRFLKKHDIDLELHTAGEHKRTLTVLGKNTESGRRKFQQELDTTHDLFKDFVHRYRPQLELDKVASGEHWYGEQAKGLGLVDELRTSDDLLMDLTREADVFQITFRRKESMSRRLTLAVETAMERWMGRG